MSEALLASFHSFIVIDWLILSCDMTTPFNPFSLHHNVALVRELQKPKNTNKLIKNARLILTLVLYVEGNVMVKRTRVEVVSAISQDQAEILHLFGFLLLLCIIIIITGLTELFSIERSYPSSKWDLWQGRRTSH